MRRVLIVNPYASAVTPRLADDVARTIGADEVQRTERRGHATELARDACRAFDEVYVFSGDGGFNEAVNGAEAETPLGFVPGGGTSVLPRALGLPREPVRAAEQLVRGRTRRISLGRVDGRRFTFSAGIGLDAELVRRVDALGRDAHGRRPGDVRFTITAVRVVAARRGRFEPSLGVHGVGRAAFALIANCDPYSYVGPVPLRVAPRARFELGLDLVAPRRVRASAWPRLLAYVLRGRGQDRARDVIYGHDLDALEVTCDVPMPLQLDGEDLGDVTRASITCERGAVTVLV